LALEFPDFDPNAFSFGALSVKWYALSYIIGLLYGYFFTSRQLKLDDIQKDRLLFYSALGVIIGGRLGYVFFYNLQYYASNPLEILKVWQGGMSFHGGLLGVFVACILFCKKCNIKLLPFLDLVACQASFGIFFGRIANFINGELHGKVTDVSWAFIFYHVDNMPRHPVQIYEALLEGMLLFCITNILYFKTGIKTYFGLTAGIWVTLYSLFRIFLEAFREPDSQIGYILNFFTMGQILSLLSLTSGILLCVFSVTKKLAQNPKSTNAKA